MRRSRHAIAVAADSLEVRTGWASTRGKLVDHVRASVAAFTDSEQRHRMMMDVAGDAILISDFDSARFIEVNAAACAMFGYDELEFQQMTGRVLAGPNGGATVEQVYADERETFREPIAETSLMTREVAQRDLGGTRAKVVAFVKRKPDMTRAEFSDYWENTHGPLFLATEEVSGAVVKYVQNHTLESNTGPLNEFDGVVEIGFRRPEEIGAAFGHPAYLERIRPDEERFLDLERMIVVNTDEKLLYEDAL